MKERVDQWRFALEGDDDHAIRRQLHSLAWNVASFRCFVQAVRQHPGAEQGAAPLNTNMFWMLHDGFWATTFLSIRRMVDPSPFTGPRGVFSLRSVLDDIRRHQPQLTRQVFVEVVSGLPYDPVPVEKAYWDYVFQQPAGGAFFVPRELDADPIHSRHAQFDVLSGTTPETRRPDDLVRPDVFDRLAARLDRANAIKDHVDTRYAHAATPDSRKNRGLETWNLGEAEEALANLAQTAELISRWFVYGGMGDVLPTPQFDQFEHLDNPWMPHGDMTPLHESWQAFAELSAQWPMIGDDEL